MGWASRQKELGIKLELTWFDPRSAWKKKHSYGKVNYFKFPDSKTGYEAALQEWFALKNELAGRRRNSEVYERHQQLFGLVQSWYDSFGVPASESKVADQVGAFLAWVADLVAQPDLPDSMPILAFCRENKRAEFWNEFGSNFTLLGRAGYELPAKWIDRLDRANANIVDKEPQTIGYWIDKYISRVAERGGQFIKKTSAKDRKYKLSHFKSYCDKLAHITTIDETYLETYHASLDGGGDLEQETKKDYFAVFRMFVRWCSHRKACELVAPPNLDSKEFGFREPDGTGRKRQGKKAMLWTVAEFKQAIEKLPAPYSCYLMLMLNCGFRHVDLSELRKVDLHLKDGRIVIQRNKLNQQATAPVISYKLWPKTIELLKAEISTDPVFVFRNEHNGPVENSIKLFWKRYREKYAKGKRLDFLRKTGATHVARHDTHLDEMYLGETLSRTAKISYSFVDGEPCKPLDDAIGVLGSEFGFCSAPVKRVTLTQEVLDALKKAGVDVAKLV